MFRYIFLFFASCISLACFAQARTIYGTVIDSAGKPIDNVNVVAEKFSVGAATDKNGKFSLVIHADDVVLTFSKVGYQTQVMGYSFKGSASKEIKMQMYEMIEVVGEVVVSAQANKLNQTERMGDENGTYLLAGKKTEVISITNANVNLSLKTGRQLFARVPGVFVYDLDGSGNQLSISNRGLDPHRSWEYNVRRNGVLTNSDMYGYPASHYNVPMEAVERVELVRGTGALQYGAQFGGMINYVTKTPDLNKPISFESITTAGSYGLFSSYASIGGCKGKWVYSAYINKRVYDGYRKNNKSEGAAHAVSLQYNASPKLTLKAELAHSVYTFQLPGPLSDSMFRADPRQSTRARNYYSPDIYVPSFSLVWHISEKTQLNFVSSAVLGTRSSVMFIGFSDRLDVVDTATNDYRPRQVDIDRFKSFTNEVRIKHQYKLGSVKSVLVAGVQTMNNDLHRTQQGVGTTGFDYDLSLTQPGWRRDMHFKTNNIALFAENIFYITSRFSVSPGIRYENGETNLTGSVSYYNPEKLPLKIAHNFPLLGISAQYKINSQNRLYAGFSQAYRPMLFKDVVPASSIEQIDPKLKDAFGYNMEAGFSGKLKSFINYDVTFFRIVYNNRIGGLVLQDTGGNFYNYKTNIGNSITDGLELYVEVTPVRSKNFEMSVFTSTSYMNGRYVKGTVAVGNVNTGISGKKLESVPEIITRNGINAAYKGISASVQYSYVSKSYSDAFNTEVAPANGSRGPVPAYGLLDFNMTVKFLKNYSVKFGVNNLTNEQYFTKRPTFYPDPGIWPSDGRSFYITAGFRF